jgi:dUTP pyrophosphatase
MKIKIKYHNKYCLIVQHGDWIDLKAAETVNIPGPKLGKDKKIEFSNALVSLGISMELPKYMEANIVPRSSTYNTHRVIQANHMGVIDYKYCGDNDIWRINLIAFEDTTIQETTRICQFRIRPTQNAPWWVKLKWFFTKNIEFVEVPQLGNKDRGGFGSTNTKK